jgi:hypothetical protein
MKYIKLVAATGLYVVLLIAIYWAHIHFFKVNVVFYAAIVDGVIATAVTLLLLWIIRPLRVFSGFERVLIAVVWLLIGYAYAISVPTVIDRSLSFYTLEKLQQRGGAIQVAALERVYATEYMKEHRLVDVRLTEQQQSGTITITDGCVRLTPRGDFLATASRFFRTYFLPKQRLLMGEYSSDLTDPFRSSTTTVDYLCR